MSGYIKTMKDLEAATYGFRGSHGNALLKSAGVVGGFGTPHDDASGNPFTAASGLGDLYGVLYGQKVWSMLNQEVNALSMMAKRPYTSSGWRVLKSRPQGGANAAFSLGNGAAGDASPAAARGGGGAALRLGICGGRRLALRDGGGGATPRRGILRPGVGGLLRRADCRLCADSQCT